MTRSETIAAALLTVFFAVGVAGHAFATTFPLMLAFTPWVLLVAGIIVFGWEARRQTRTFLVWAAVTYVVTFFLEVIGTKTGLVFGAYTYGATLGRHLLEVPLVIGFNWTIVVLGCISFTTTVVKNRYAAPVAAAVLAVIFDIFLEPVAIRLDYWTWTGGPIPIQNYIAWFVISLAAGIGYQRLRLARATWLPAFYALLQTVFFVALRMTPAT